MQFSAAISRATSIIIKATQYFLSFLFFVIPVVWWTRLNANYYSTKLTLLFLAGALAWLALPTKISLPRLPRAMLGSLVLIVAFQVIYHTSSLKLEDFLYFFKFLSFSALTIWCYTLNFDLEMIYKKNTYAIFLSLVSILAVSFYEFYINRVINLSTNILTTLGAFGNVNMFAEFLILTLPFLFHWTRHKDKVSQGFKLLLFSIWVFFILYCRSRSAWLGLALWLLLQFRYKITKKELLYVGLSFCLYFASLYAPTKVDDAAANQWKTSSLESRMALYWSTIELIKDHPWGISVGHFMSELVPYQMKSSVKPVEYSYYDQPHSEFLKWGAQFGWLFLVVVGVFCSSVIFQLGKWFFEKKNSYLVESFIVLFPQLLFQFPFENPASLLYLSLLWGLFFLKFPSGQTIQVHFSYRPVVWILFLLGFYNAFAFVNSVYQESTIPRNENIVSACNDYPINVKACHAKLTYFIDNKKYDNFLAEFKADLSNQPLFVDYLRLLPTYYSLKQNNKKTCEALFFYQIIYSEQISFDKKYYENCRGYPNIFLLENPQQLKARYLTWLDGL